LAGNPELFALDRYSRELDAWVWYFDHHLGWRPATLTAFIEQETKGFTVPAQWPEWFDLQYRPPAVIPRVRYSQDDRYETLEDLQHRLGKTFGLGCPPPPGSYQDMVPRYGRPIGRFEAAPPVPQTDHREAAE